MLNALKTSVFPIHAAINTNSKGNLCRQLYSDDLQLGIDGYLNPNPVSGKKSVSVHPSFLCHIYHYT